MNPRILSCCLLTLLSVSAFAQAPTGIVLGTITDETGAVVPNATISITNKATGAARTLTANSEGLYSAPSLAAGDYEVRVEMAGFRTVVRDAQVLAGSSTTVNLTLAVGTTQEVVNVEAATAQINYETHTVAGVIQHQTIQELPLNGRSFLQLATLEPGVTTAPGTTSQFNSLFSVTVLGISKVRYTMDGGMINDEVDGSGNWVSMNFSQEVVQEFQMASVNFDLSSGIASSGGTINVVTRSGSNDFHGSGYFFYRDHNLAAYPVLQRLAIAPNPYFARKNPGFYLGGPILKDKLFFFFNLERTFQTQVFPVREDLASLQPMNSVVPAPYVSTLISARFDYRLSSKHNLFARYSHDGNHSAGPFLSNNSPLSTFDLNRNWSDQSILGVTSILTPTVVNDFRYMYHYWQNNNETEPAEACVLPCVGGGLPSLVGMIGSATFQAGLNVNAPQNHTSRSYQVSDTVNWQKGTHRFRFGFDFERMNTLYSPWNFCVLSCLYVYSPEVVQAQAGAQLNNLFPNLPKTVGSNQDLLNLPVFNTTSSLYSGISIGDGTWPGLYHRNQNRHNSRPMTYVTDVWKIKPNLTINYGLGYSYESGLFDSDLPHPQFLAPIFGSNLQATPANKTNFSPAFGFAWSPGKSAKTVIRGGAGLYWDTQPIYQRFREDAAIGPVGDGRSTLAASILTNIFPGIVNVTTGQPVPVGGALPLNSLTNMTLGQYIQIYNQQIGALTQKLAPTPPTTGPYTVTGLDVAKQGTEIYPPNYPVMRSYQTSIGVQRDLGHNMVVTADWARRQYENVQIGEVDLNRFARRINGVLSPVIPACRPDQIFIPGQECSTGSITVWTPEGRTIYDGLLVKLQKRYSNHSQFAVSYALQKQMAVVSGVVNPDNYFATWGPVLARHNLNVAGLLDLPWGFKLSVNNSIISRTPFNPYIPGIDLNGAGYTSFPLSEAVSGVSYNCFNQGCGKADLSKAVDAFNSTWAGKKDARGAAIPAIVLPSHYQFYDPTYNTDFRVTKEVRVKERLNFQVFGEFFNAFNIANLSGYSTALDTKNPDPSKQTYAFGQPTQRFGQIFGSGGPRAIQVGGRISF